MFSMFSARDDLCDSLQKSAGGSRLHTYWWQMSLCPLFAGMLVASRADTMPTGKACENHAAAENISQAVGVGCGFPNAV